MFKKFNQGGGRFGGGGRGGDRDRDSGRSEMFRATCAECGQSCEVPFKPNGSKPVFCRDCFQQQGGGDRDSRRGGGDRGGRDFGSRDFGRDRGDRGGRDFEEKEMFDAVCVTCGEDCQVPFRPKSGKPIYCRDCMGKRNPREDRNPDFAPRTNVSGVSAEQFEALSAKVDKILKLLQGNKTHTVKKEDLGLEEAIAPEAKAKAVPVRAKVKKAKSTRKKG